MMRLGAVLIPFIAGVFLNETNLKLARMNVVLIPFIAGVFLNNSKLARMNVLAVLIPFIAGVFLNKAIMTEKIKTKRLNPFYCRGVFEFSMISFLGKPFAS